MAVRNQFWYNRNTSRSYPFDDEAGLIADDGSRLPNNLISDLHLLFPDTAGKYAQLSAITVGPEIVTLIFTGMDSPTGPVTMPLASFSLRRPVPGQQYWLEPLLAGTGGWIVFGNGLKEAYQGRFSRAGETLLSPAAARWQESPPIPSIGKLAIAASLQGIVTLSGGNDIEIVEECLAVPSHPIDNPDDPQSCDNLEEGPTVRRVLVFRLKSKSGDFRSTADNVLNKYKGPCGGRPESGTCGEPAPIEFLASVQPDCCGNITIEFRGCADLSEASQEALLDSLGEIIEVAESIPSHGIIVDCDLGLIEACVTPEHLPDSEGRLPNEYDDLCISVSEASQSLPDILPEEEVSFSENSLSEETNQDPTLPLHETFNTLGPWVLRSGQFGVETSSELFVTQNMAARNVATYEPSPAINNGWYKKITTQAKLRSEVVGGLHNAAIIFNYKPRSPGSAVYTYYVAEIDWDGYYQGYKVFRIGRFNGSRWATEFAVPVPAMALDEWYSISIQIYPQPNEIDAWLVARLVGVTSGDIDITIGPLAVKDFGPADGLFGLGTNRASTRFSTFSLENL